MSPKAQTISERQAVSWENPLCSHFKCLLFLSTLPCWLSQLFIPAALSSRQARIHCLVTCTHSFLVPSLTQSLNKYVSFVPHFHSGIKNSVVLRQTQSLTQEERRKGQFEVRLPEALAKEQVGVSHVKARALVTRDKGLQR